MRTLDEIGTLLEELRVEVGTHCEAARKDDNLSLAVFHLDTAGDQIDSAIMVIRKSDGHKS